MMMAVSALAVAGGFGAALAGPAEQEAIRAGCLQSTNWTEKACKCLADQAGSLKDTQQAFLAATLKADKAGVTGLLMQMTQSEIMEAGMFATSAAPGCQG